MGVMYMGLLQAAKLNPDEADFTKLRHAYAKSPEYQPYLPSTEEEGRLISQYRKKK